MFKYRNFYQIVKLGSGTVSNVLALLYSFYEIGSKGGFFASIHACRKHM